MPELIQTIVMALQQPKEIKIYTASFLKQGPQLC